MLMLDCKNTGIWYLSLLRDAIIWSVNVSMNFATSVGKIISKVNQIVDAQYSIKIALEMFDLIY